jgi:2-polyprenyl-3-methyl-5-hydroxy-6-metoxy-1,4-benzoquinol methylase
MSEFDQLKELLHSDAWPKAVDESLICDPNSEEDKLARAEGILLLIVDQPLEDKKFLDFGCGEGYCAIKALEQNPIISVGYDIELNSNWEKSKKDKKDKLVFTADIEAVESNSPYDVILLYDVIDHMTLSDAKVCMGKIKSLLSPNGTVFLRNHPFCSRHATHLYHKCNKAFIHLVFTEEELKELGYDTPINAKVVYPLYMYNELTKAHFTKEEPVINRESIESFFTTNKMITERIRRHFHTLVTPYEFPVWQCEQQFLDYRLKIKLPVEI